MIPAGVQMFVSLEPVDMRLGFERLSGLVRERLGFERVAHLREVGHKFGRWLDLVFMQRYVDAPGAARQD